MELRQLAVFVAVAEEMSFTRAAHRQNVVQSAVSATLRSLERQLGVELLRRNTHQVELTDAGRVLLPEARRVLATAEQAQYVVQELHGGLRGTLHLGILQASLQGVVTPPMLIARFLAKHPGMEVQVRTGISGPHAEDLRRRRLDLAFIVLPPEDTTGLTLYRLFAETMGLVVPADHPLAGRDRVSLGELADEPFVESAEGWGTRIAVDRAFIRARATRVIRYEVAGTEAHDFVRNGLGVAILPPSTVPADLAFVPIARYAPRFVISLAVANREPSVPVREMVRIARQLARGDVDEGDT